MPRELPSSQALHDVVEDAWATADPQVATDLPSLPTQLSVLPTSALLGNQMIGDFSPQVCRSIQKQQLNLFKLAIPALL